MSDDLIAVNGGAVAANGACGPRTWRRLPRGRWFTPLPWVRLWWVILSVSLSASVSAVEDVPFITTPDRVTVAMLELARVCPSDHVIDLGSGDGRIVITAARRHGATGLGVEIVPDLVARSREAAHRAGVVDRVRFMEQDLFQTDLTPASVITMYLTTEVNRLLKPRLQRLAPGTRIVSHDWDLGEDWPPDATLTLDVPEKTIGREKRSRLYLWVVPHPDGRSIALPQACPPHSP